MEKPNNSMEQGDQKIPVMNSTGAIAGPLSEIFSRLEARGQEFPDEDIDRIAELLSRGGKKVWSTRPRTFAILHMLDLESLMDNFVDEKLSDYDLPYALHTLPNFVARPHQRTKFIELQKFVLTDAKNMENGSHALLAGDGGKHFTRLRTLGRGGFGAVDEITSNLSFRTFALKRLLRRRRFEGDKVAEQTFRNEVQNLKTLSHQHLVKYVGSYTDAKYFGILLLPVASCNLREYLGRENFPETDFVELRQFFGCITSAIVYLHRSSRRHKDLKPSNVLILRGEVYISDFGLTLDWSEVTKSVTEGPPGAMSVNYVAPEVADGKARGSSSDMWSVGCIFLDMLTVLKRESLESKKRHFESTGSKEVNPRLNREGFDLWMEKLSGKHDTFPWLWTKELLAEDPEERCTAEQLLDRIFSCCDEEDGYAYHCLQCYDNEHEEFSDEEPAESQQEKDTDGPQSTPEAVLQNLLQAVYWSRQRDVRIYLQKMTRYEALNDASARSILYNGEILNKAIVRGDKFIVEDLLKHGFDVNTPWEGHAPLHTAIIEAKEEILKLLLGQKADVNIQFEPGLETPLHVAIQRQNRTVVQILLDNHADPNLSNSQKDTPLHLAAVQAPGCLKLLIESPNIDLSAMDAIGSLPIHCAALSRSPESLKILLDHGQDINCLSRNRDTALMPAMSVGAIANIQMLLHWGIDVNIKMGPGRNYTALHRAVENESVEYIRELLQAKVKHDTSSTNSRGHTALGIAVLQESSEIASLLLEANFKLENCLPSGGSPLHYVIRQNNLPMAQLFLDHGQDINAKDGQGDTCVHMVMVVGPILLEALNFLLDKEADMNTTNAQKNTPLISALAHHHSELALTLIRRGADVTVFSPEGFSPLHLAVLRGDEAVVDALLEKGVDPNTKNFLKDYPIHTAAAHGRISIAQKLLDAGADPSMKDGNGLLAEGVAARYNHEDLQRILRERRYRGHSGWSWRTFAKCVDFVKRICNFGCF